MTPPNPNEQPQKYAKSNCDSGKSTPKRLPNYIQREEKTIKKQFHCTVQYQDFETPSKTEETVNKELKTKVKQDKEQRPMLKKRTIRQVNFGTPEPENNDDQSLQTTMKKIHSQLTSENSETNTLSASDLEEEYTVNIFAKKREDTNNFSIEISQPQVTLKQKCLFGGQRFHSIGAMGTLDDLDRPGTKKLEMSSLNSFAIGSDNQIYNLINKNLFLQQEDKDLIAINKKQLILSLKNEDQRHVLNQGYKKKIICNCRKTKCLKLYCECYVNGEMCSDECNCCDCHNNEEHAHELEQARKETLEKNPSAFKSKIKESQKAEQRTHYKGCNCKNSGCQKKYCECYNLGVKCTKLCQCKDCKNGKPHTHDHNDLPDIKISQSNENSAQKQYKPFFDSYPCMKMAPRYFPTPSQQSHEFPMVPPPYLPHSFLNQSAGNPPVFPSFPINGQHLFNNTQLLCKNNMANNNKQQSEEEEEDEKENNVQQQKYNSNKQGKNKNQKNISTNSNNKQLSGKKNNKLQSKMQQQQENSNKNNNFIIQQEQNIQANYAH